MNSDTNKRGQLSPRAEESNSFTRIFRIPVFPKRFIILTFISLANLNMCCMRMCLNVTIVAMTHGEGKYYNTSGPHLSKDMVSICVYKVFRNYQGAACDCHFLSRHGFRLFGERTTREEFVAWLEKSFPIYTHCGKTHIFCKLHHKRC